MTDDATLPVLALDIGGTQVRGALVDADGRVLRAERVRTPVEEGGPAIVEAGINVLRRVRDAADGAAGSRIAIAGIGISSAGPVDPYRGWILDPPNLGPTFRDLPIAETVGTALALPAFLDRDTQIAALAEGAHGAAAGLRDYLYITVSTGLGGAIVSDGRLLRGPDGTAGELGHILIDR